MEWEERVAAKNGVERVNAIRTRLQRVGRGVGIDFSFNSRVGGTKASHCLIRQAPVERRKELIEEIYRMHFEQDMDITSHTGLAKAATSIGIDEDEALTILKNCEGGDEVDKLAAKARKVDGVTSVPTIEMGGRRIEGAEDVGEFYEALVAAKEG